MQLQVLETGGTINGILGPDDPSPTKSRVLAWLEQNRSHLNLALAVEFVCMKDSRAITDADRAQLVATLNRHPGQHILIPHGTYTMPETGVYLRQHLPDAALEKSIILVGSLIPLGEPESDAPANLDFALKVLEEGRPGVWIAMQETLWNPGEVVKQAGTGKYVDRS